MNRRKFLGSTVAAAVCGAGAASARGAVAASAVAVGTAGAVEQGRGASPAVSRVADRVAGSALRLGLAAYSFRKELSGPSPTMTLEGFIDYCAERGLEATELTEYYFRSKDPQYVRALRRRAYVNGLAISGAPVGNNFCLPAGPQRSQQITHVKRWIDTVALLGAQTIRVFAGSVATGSSEDDARKWAVEGLAECAAYAGERAVLLALENHGGITASADDLLALVAAVGSPWLGVNLDTGNFHQRVYESLAKAAPHAISVQVKVEIRAEGQPAEPTDYARVVKILRDAAYRGYVALEYESAEDAAVAVPRHLEQLRAAIDA